MDRTELVEKARNAKPWEYVNTLDALGYQVGCLGTVTRLFVMLPSRHEIHLEVSGAYVGYSAIDSNTYDASFDDGEWKQGAHGMAATEIDAIDDLLDQLEEEFPHVGCTCDRDHYCPSCFEEVKTLEAARSSNANTQFLMDALKKGL